jgi:hypothetical protein
LGLEWEKGAISVFGVFGNVLLQGVRDYIVLFDPSAKIKCTESLHFHFHSLCAVWLTLIDSSNREYSWEGVAIASAASPVNMDHNKNTLIPPYGE